MRIEWAGTALADLARLDKQVALRVKVAMEQFAEIGIGDVKRLKVLHRSEAYR